MDIQILKEGIHFKSRKYQKLETFTFRYTSNLGSGAVTSCISTTSGRWTVCNVRKSNVTSGKWVLLNILMNSYPKFAVEHTSQKLHSRTVPVSIQQHSFYSSILVSFSKVSLLSPQAPLPVFQNNSFNIRCCSLAWKECPTKNPPIAFLFSLGTFCVSSSSLSVSISSSSFVAASV